MALYNYNSATKAFSLYRGDSFTQVRTVTKDGSTYNITGLSIYFTVKDSSNLTSNSDSGAKFQLSVGSGITITDGSAGEYTIDVSKTNTALAPGTYSYDIEIVDGTSIHTVVKGDFIILEDVTKT